ncbi:hypothetical protein [Massilia sp. METH4]|uniref:hypothetical protein n=1 Tax=Massilia sp. METH4 TaxID=3123041 RepID=UPI0030D150E6
MRTLLLAMLTLFALRPQPAQAADAECAFDRAAMLAQDLASFDQGPDGWRKLERKPACVGVAADLIADYRSAHPELRQHFDAYLLYWHEGQVRAVVGQYAQAEPLFAKSRLPQEPMFQAWNLYVDGTLAFLRKDGDALRRARDGVASLAQPLNLDVLDGLLRCLDKSYSEAYGPCRASRSAQ